MYLVFKAIITKNDFLKEAQELTEIHGKYKFPFKCIHACPSRNFEPQPYFNEVHCKSKHKN